MDDMSVTLVFHHGVHFESNSELVYIEGEEDCWDYLDVDEILVSIVDQLFKEYNYLGYKSVWWLCLVLNYNMGLGHLK